MEANILNFGAVADGKTLNSRAIQKAIDTVAEAGGGRVTIPAGTYLTGTIWLKSNIELHFENGAVLKASENLDDYNDEEAYPQNYWSRTEGWMGKHVIIALSETNISITGKGVINGSGEVFFDGEPNQFDTGFAWRYGIIFNKKDCPRPGQTIAIVDCRDVTIRDVGIVNAPAWCFFLHGCENVTVKGIRVKNCPWHANTDGIDIDACKNVTVSDCIIDTGDDAIAIRCVGYRIREDLDVCENITVTNCVLTSRSCGVRVCVGRGTIRNVTMSNLIFKESSPAILLSSSYMKNGKVNIEDILISNCIADDVGRSITIYESNDCYIKNVSVSNFTGRVMCQSKIYAEEKGSIRNISLRDVHFEFIKQSFNILRDYRPEQGYHAFELDGVDGARFDNVNVIIPEDIDMELYKEVDSENILKTNCNF